MNTTTRSRSPIRRLAISTTALGVLLIASSCGGAETRSDQPLPDANDPAYAASLDGEMDERVSTSAGEEGGFVVLWPRVVTGAGADGSAEAAQIQAQLRAVVEGLADGAPVDVRPDPERACPRQGCLGTAVGAVLLKTSAACAVVATVSRPGPTAAHLMAWAGELELRNHNVPFREPPEDHVSVVDFLPCADLSAALAAGEPELAELIGQSR